MTLENMEILRLDDSRSNRNDSTSSTESEGSEVDDTLLYHMQKKYLEEPEVDSFINFFGTSPCKLACERHLELMVLNKKGISSIGDELSLAPFVATVVDLDLAYNEINDWNVVAGLLNSMPLLKRLNLSHNPLQKQINTDLPQCSNIKSLLLNGTNLPLKSLAVICKKLPNLQELDLNKNDSYSKYDPFPEVVSATVTQLQLNACDFQDWNVVLHVIKAFPGVERLYLSENKISNVEPICPVTGISTTDITAKIKFLSLHNCSINDWNSIEKLDLMTRLEELKILNNPLFEQLPNEEKYHLVVGRLPKLKILNGSPITDTQREDSERFFIRFYQGHEEKPAIWNKLVSIHGNLEQLVKVDFTPRKWALVILRCEEKGICIRLKVRLTKTVMDLMKFASKLTEISVPLMRIFYHDIHVDSHGPTELRFPGQALQYLRIEDGDEFFIQSKILPPEKSVIRSY